MGLLRSVEGIMELIYEEGLKEWLDETKYMEILDELYSELQTGKITEEEYDEEEARVIDRLKEIRQYKKDNDIEF